MGKRFEPDIEEFTDLCKRLKSSVKVAAYYNVCPGTIRSLADKLQLPVRITQKVSAKEREEIYSLKDDTNVTSRQLAKKYGCTKTLILDIWHKKGKVNNRKRYRKYKIENEKLFSNLNNETAYFLGFIASDGCIFRLKNSNKQATISISLKDNDEYILEYFKKLLGTDKPISHTTITISTGVSVQSRLEISSNRIADDLEKLGITPNKTKNVVIPNIDKKYMICFIHGYFDGDGSVYLKNSKKGLELLSPSNFCFAITGYEYNMNKISMFLESFGIYSSFNQDRRSALSTITGKFGDLRINNIYSMYAFSNILLNFGNKTCLTRKMDKFRLFIPLVDNNNSSVSKQIIFYYNAVYTKYVDMYRG